MAREIVTHLWCDPCDAKDEKTPGHSVMISLDGKKPVEIDICDVHDKELLAPLRELIGEVGQPVDKALPGMPPAVATSPRGEVKKDCPTCPPGRALTREGLRGHMRKLHGHNRDEANEVVRSIFGGTTRQQKPFSEQCPECKEAGVPKKESTYDTPQGFGAHRKAAHGVTGAGAK